MAVIAVGMPVITVGMPVATVTVIVVRVFVLVLIACARGGVMRVVAHDRLAFRRGCSVVEVASSGAASPR